MTTTNKPMTGEQLDELMTVSVNMQRESERLGDRSAAMFAYAVQVAVLELRSVRKVVEQLAVENAAMKAVCEDRRVFIMNGVQLGYIQVPTVETDPALETIRVAVSPQEPTPATDAILAEVRASGVEQLASLAGNECQRYKLVGDRSGVRKWKSIVILCTDFAAQIRKGVHS